jgi:hypothetical protein
MQRIWQLDLGNMGGDMPILLLDENSLVVESSRATIGRRGTA